MNKFTKILVLLMAVMMLFSFAACGENIPEEGEEVTITVKVVHKDKSEKTFTITTKKATLLGALQQENLVDGESQTAGFYMTTVDGELADESEQGWWCLTKGGETWWSGVNITEIADGDCYELTYTIGYSFG